VPNALVDFPGLLQQGLAGQSRRRKYLIGVSGGKDSMALLHGLLLLGFKRLVVCHLNHRLRGGVAAADACFVARQASILGLSFHEGKIDVLDFAAREKLSLETAAREARHQFFSDCSKQERCSRVFLAHHQDDQIETILHHFFRGSGRRGLGGMMASSVVKIGRRRLELLRPMLDIPRAAIESWLEQKQILWREDATNLSPAHTRNRLRHELLPKLAALLGRDFRAPILRLASILGPEDDFLDSLAANIAKGRTLAVADLREQPLALQRRTILLWLRNQRLDEPGFREVQTVLRLLNPSGVPAKVNLPGDRHARRRAGRIFLEP